MLMKKLKAKWLATSVAIGVLTAGSVAAQAQAKEPGRPNFLLIVADDLGFSDLGAFGGEIQTPNLDRLALEGVRLTGYHTSSMCAPTRAQLLTGVDNHRNGLGQMHEPPASRYAGLPGYEGALRSDVATLPEILSDNGYRTVQAGKWHLGVTPANDPSQRGFQYSYVLLQGAHDHYGADLTADPTDGKTSRATDALKGATYRENGRTLTELPKDFYSSDQFTSKLIEGLQRSRAEQGDKPFFGYLAFSAPHWPLHAPAESIAKYRGQYDQGYEALRDQRIRRQRELGLVSASQKIAPNPEVRPWSSLSDDEKAYYIASQEAYAGMVDRLDYNIGRVVDYLKSTGEYENTVILFHSDNGAAGRDFLRDQKPFPPYAKADNRPENIGAPGSFAAVGSGWAAAATEPANLYKRYQTEGGTRVVALLHYNGLPRTGGGADGMIDGVYTHVRDVTPTFLELASIAAPTGSYKGRAIQPISGRSQLPYWRAQTDRIYPADVPVGGELYGSKSLRKGDWKLVSVRGVDWALYNLAQDAGETVDLSASNPDKLAELKADWATYARENQVIEDPAFYAAELGDTTPQ